MLRIVSLFSFLCITFSVFAQQQQRWHQHLPYQKGEQLVATKNKIFCLTQSGLFSYSLADNEIIAYNRSNGLTDTEITAMGVANWDDCILLGYKSGNIDIIRKGKISTIADIARFSAINNKSIRCITAYNKKVYLGTDFGVVILNINKNEITTTCYIGTDGSALSVNDLAIFNNEIWAATKAGIYKAATNAFNLADYASWQLIAPTANIPFQQIIVADNKVYAFRNSDKSVVFQLQNDLLQQVYGGKQKVFRLANINNQLGLIHSGSIVTLKGKPIIDIDLPKPEFRDICSLQNRVFIADHGNAMLEISNTIKSIRPDGPLSNKITAICGSNNAIWAVDGRKNNENNAAQLFGYIQNRWKNFTSENITELKGKKNMVAVAADRLDAEKLYVSLWNQGVMIFKNNQIENFFQPNNTDVNINKIAAITTDKRGNLWMINANDSRPIKVWNRSKGWSALGNPNLSSSDFKKIIALSNGDKWILKHSGKRIFAFNENGTIANSDDDVLENFRITNKNGDLIANTIYDMAEDIDKKIWVATSEGVAIYTNPGAILRDGDFFAFRPIIKVDNVTQYLLSSEKVLSIAINGANQKWLGTASSGVYLISDTGDKQLKHFTTSNSPLPSNRIEQIAINQQSGEVFFVTNKGMVSYSGTVTAGNSSYSHLYAYPNPVRENYKGDITITGLKANSSIRITDVSGNLVATGQSVGGQFLWNGNNLNGNRVHTGVYLIFCADDMGKQAKVIKLLVVN